MARYIAGDIRLDPRIKAFLADDEGGPEGDVESREALLAEANSAEARAGAEQFRQFMERFDTEEAAPSAGLRIHVEKVISQPDGNTINLQVIRPVNGETLPCVYYIHGGGMGFLSCFDGMFRGWGKLIAANGVAVVMVDFRNAVVPSSVPEIAPFPAGLNDCVSGGGGNLTLATGLKLKRDGELGLIRGLYAIAPFIKGQWPTPDCPSSTENNGILIDVHTNRATVGYGIEAFNERDPLAWPSFATATDVEGFPPLLLAAGVPARDLAAFCKG